MPVREELPKGQEATYAYEYEVLLKHIREHIDTEYGGVANFLQTKRFEEIGLFHGTEQDKNKMFTYLSLPADGEKARVRSFPVISKLFEELLGITLESKITVVREQRILSDTKLTKKK